jgi:glutathione peroxidase
MKQILVLASLIISIVSTQTLSIYSFSLPGIDGGTISLNDYQGKKLLIVILPDMASPQDSMMLKQLDTLCMYDTANFKVIGVPAYESGYSDSLGAFIKNAYRQYSQNLTISQALYTRKSAGANQHPLFNWLTHVTENTRFDEDVAGAGSKFFVNGQGELLSYLSPEIPLQSRSLQRLLQ